MQTRYSNLVRQVGYPMAFIIMIGSLWVMAWSNSLVANASSTAAPLFAPPYNLNTTTSPTDNPAVDEQITSIHTGIDD